MPLYEYECECGHRFEEFHSIGSRHDAICPVCSRPVRLRISLSDFRFATPLTVYQDLGGNGSRHRGYQEIGYNPDSGPSPKPGQPYKTDKQVAKEEEHGDLGITEV